MRLIRLLSQVLFVSLWSMAVLADGHGKHEKDSGLSHVKSAYDVATTLDRLDKVLKSKGMNVFARIDHAEGAGKIDQALRPTQLLIFGNPKVGTPLMQCQQTVAIDLPQKALAWEDEEGHVWLTYNDPTYLSQRHEIEGCEEVLGKVSNALAMFAKAATQAEPSGEPRDKPE